MSLPAGLTLYNPDLLSKSDLIAGFIARQPLLEELLDDLRRTSASGSPQHHLLLGQRGLGKTTLLRRLAFAIADEPQLCAIWQPLIFPEEQYNVSKLDDFWLNCADSLSDALEQAGKKREAEALDDKVAQLGPKPPPGAALDLLLTQATQIDRRLVLLVDNLDIILGRIGEAEEWPFRRLLSNESRLLIIGASSRAMEAFYEHKRAFYDFFQIHELKGLDEAETFSVLHRLANQSAKPEIEKLIQDQPARIQTLRQLTGGNPRTIVLLFRILAQNPDGDANLDLEQLLDLYTPLYKARFEELPDQAQKLVDLMALHWDPLTAGDLSVQAGWTVNNVSAQLNRLEDLRVIEKVPWFGEKKTGFQIAERFFNIWYLMRASRRVRRKLIWLVRFLESWYSEEDLRQKGEEHLRCDTSVLANERYAELSFAYAQVAPGRLLQASLESAGLRAALADDKVREYFDFSDLPQPLLDKKARMEAMRKLAKQVPKARKDWAGIDPKEFWRLLAGSPYYDFNEKKRLAQNLADLSDNQVKELFEQLVSDKKKIQHHYWQESNTVEQLYTTLAEGEMVDAFDWQSAYAIGGQNLQALAISSITNTIFDRSTSAKIEKAHEVLLEMIEEPSCAPRAWNSLGYLLDYRLQRIEEAEEAYRKATQLDPSFAYPWINLGNLLLHNYQRFDQAEEAYLKAIELDPSNSVPWNGLGNLLQSDQHRFDQFDQAEKAYRKAIELDPTNPDPWNGLGLLLHYHFQQLDQAEVAFKKSIQLGSAFPQLLNNLGRLLIQQERRTEALPLFLDALRGDPNSELAALFLEMELPKHTNNATDLKQSLDLARQALKLLPAKSNLHWVLLQLLCLDANWQEAHQHFQSLSDKPDLEISSEAISALRVAVKAGQTKELLKTLEASNAQDRWRPLYEALRATKAGSIDYLRRVAPEVQTAAKKIYEQLNAN